MSFPENFTPIPKWPGFAISPEGAVFSRYGRLTPDRYGAYTLACGKMRKRLKPDQISEILKADRMIPKETPPAAPEKAPEPQEEPRTPPVESAQGKMDQDAGPDELAEAKKALARAERRLRYQRSLNATLWARLRRLSLELESLGKDAKKRRIVREEAEWAEFSNDFSELEF